MGLFMQETFPQRGHCKHISLKCVSLPSLMLLVISRHQQVGHIPIVQTSRRLPYFTSRLLLLWDPKVFISAAEGNMPTKVLWSLVHYNFSHWPPRALLSSPSLSGFRSLEFSLAP